MMLFRHSSLEAALWVMVLLTARMSLSNVLAGG